MSEGLHSQPEDSPTVGSISGITNLTVPLREGGTTWTSHTTAVTTSTGISAVDPSSLVSNISTAASDAAPADNLPWDLGHYEGGEDKNPFGDISEEQMNKLDEVLSLDEVQKFLQQSGSAHHFPANISQCPSASSTATMADPSSGQQSNVDKPTTAAAPALIGQTCSEEEGLSSGLLSDDRKVDTEPLKLDAFDLDDLATHEIIKKGIREQDVAKIALSFSDHAYALAPRKEVTVVQPATPTKTTTTGTMASPSPASVRKSSRIARRKGETTEEETTEDSEDTGKDEGKSDEKDGDSKESSDDQGKAKEKGKGKKGKRDTPEGPRGTRRSTRISEHEQREMAEKIRQENIRQEKEDMEAMMKVKEEERMEVEHLAAERLAAERWEMEQKEVARQETELQQAEKLAKEKALEEKRLQAEKEAKKEEKKGGMKKGMKGLVRQGIKEAVLGRGRGRGAGKRKGAMKDTKPGAMKDTKPGAMKAMPKRKGRGRGGKKTDDSESQAASQESSTEDDVPLKNLTTPKTPKQSKQSKKKQPSKVIGSDAEDDLPLQKLSKELNKELRKTNSDEKLDKSVEKEKKAAEEGKAKSVSQRHRKSSANRKSESELQALDASMSDLFKPDGVIVHQQEEPKSGTSETGCQADNESDGQVSYEDDENDSDWDPGDDPKKLWCICKKPHGNSRANDGKKTKDDVPSEDGHEYDRKKKSILGYGRSRGISFMICCDQCQGWFHGKCVGITRERGKEMEKYNEEYVCPECTVKGKWKDSEDAVEADMKGGATSGRKTEQPDKPPQAEGDGKKRFSLPREKHDRRKRPDWNQVKKEEPEDYMTIEQDEANVSVEKDDEISPVPKSSCNPKIKGHGLAKDSSNIEGKNKPTDVKVKQERSFLSVLSDISQEPEQDKVKTKLSESPDLKVKVEIGSESSASDNKIGCNSGNPHGKHEKRRHSRKSASEDDTKPEIKTEKRDSGNLVEQLTPHKELKHRDSHTSTGKPEEGTDAKIATPKTEKRRDYGEKIEKTLEEIRKRRLEASKEKEQEQEKKKKRFKGLGDHKRTFEKCIIEKCSNESQSDSVYCSNQCIIRYAEDSIRIIRKERERSLGYRHDKHFPDKKVAIKVVVMERRTGRVLTGPSAPSENNLHEWLKLHPTFEVLRPAHSSHKISSSFYKKEKEEKVKKESKQSSSVHASSSLTSTPTPLSSSYHHSASHLSTSPEDAGPGPVRLNVRKSLRDVLAHRANEADDMMLSNSEIKKLALSVEEELYGLFHETGSKYKSKYRSLIFNIKDAKNKGLFRKILSGQIKPARLVRMSPDELASKDLAKWREMENKHSLEIIELAEKEAQEDAGKQHVTKKTHKGEQEVRDEDFSSLRDVTPEKPAAHLLSPVTPTTPTSLPGDLLSGLIIDTTEQHKMHLFDLNCKVCTGKVAPPSAEEPPPKKVKVARTVSRESQEGLSQNKNEEPMEKAEEEKTVKEVMKVIEKIKAEDEMAAYSAASSSSSSAADSTSITVRSPDSALQSGLDVKAKSQPPGAPALWKGFIHMQDTARFITSAHRVSGPTHYLTLPDAILLCGRIAPEQVWDYLARIKKSGSKDICILRFDPAAGEEKTAYIQLYSYLNSRSRCGVGGNNTKLIKDMYIVPLASHSKIPNILLPFDGPGLQDNRPHMLLGVVVKQKLKRSTDELSIVPESQPSQASAPAADCPSQVKRFKQPTAAMTPPRRSPADPRKAPSRHKEGLMAKKVSHLAAKTNLGCQSVSPEHSRPYTPPLESTPTRSSPKPPEPIRMKQDPIVKEYGDVDLQKVEAEEREKTSGQEAEAEKPYDPEDMEGIGSSTGEPNKPQASSVSIIQMADHIAGSQNPAEVTAAMFTALAASSKLNDQKTLLLEMTRRVEEQKRQIEQKKLAASLDPAASTQTASSVSNLLTSVASTGLTTTPVSTATMASSAATAAHPSSAMDPSQKEKLWEQVIKANIGDVSAKAEAPALVAPTEIVPTASKPKDNIEESASAPAKNSEDSTKSEEPTKSENLKVSEKKTEDSKENRKSRTPEKESKKDKSSPDRKGSHRSPDRSRTTGEPSSRRSRTPEKKGSSDSSRKSSSTRRHSRSPEKKERDSKRESSSRSSHRSSSRSDRSRSDSDSRRFSNKERDSGRSRYERDLRRSPRRDDKESKRSPKRDDKESKRSPRHDKESKRSPKRDDKESKRSPRHDDKESRRSPKRDDKESKRSPRRDDKEPKRSPRRDERESKSSPRRDERSRQSSRSSRSSSKEKQRRGSDSTVTKSTDRKERNKEEAWNKDLKSNVETDSKTIGASSTEPGTAAVPEKIELVTGGSGESSVKSVKPVKTESEFLDDLVLGKRKDGDPPKVSESEKAEKKEEPAFVEEANLPVIPGFGFNSIPISELTDILKRVGSSLPAGSLSAGTTSASADSSSAAGSSVTGTIATTADSSSSGWTTTAATTVDSSNSGWTTITTPTNSGAVWPATKTTGPASKGWATAVTPSPVQTPQTTIEMPGAIVNAGPLPSLLDLPLVCPPGFQGEMDKSSQDAPSKSKGDVDYRTKGFTNVGSPSNVFGFSQDAPSELLSGTSKVPSATTEQAKPLHKDVDLRRGGSIQSAASVFLGESDSDMRLKAKDGDMRLGSGDSDMRMGTSDSDMRIGGGDKDMRVRPSASPGGKGSKNKPPVLFHGQGEGTALHDTDIRKEHGGPPGVALHMRGKNQEGRSSPVSGKQDTPMCPPPLPPPKLPQRVFIGDKDERKIPVHVMGRSGQDGGQQGGQMPRQPSSSHPGQASMPGHDETTQFEGQPILKAPAMPPPLLQHSGKETPLRFQHGGPRPANVGMFRPDIHGQSSQPINVIRGQRPPMISLDAPRFTARIQGGHLGMRFPRPLSPPIRPPLLQTPEAPESQSVPKIPGDKPTEQPPLESIKSAEQRESSPGQPPEIPDKVSAQAGEVSARTGTDSAHIQVVSQAPEAQHISTSHPPTIPGGPDMPGCGGAFSKIEPNTAPPNTAPSCGDQDTRTSEVGPNESAVMDFTEDFIPGDNMFSPPRGPRPPMGRQQGPVRGPAPRFLAPGQMPFRGMRPPRGPHPNSEQDQPHNIHFNPPQRQSRPPQHGRGMIGPRGPRPFYPRQPRSRGRGRGW